MALKLFYDAISQPCRSVLLFLKCTGIDHTVVMTDISKGNNRTHEYLKLNPTGRLPSIDDNGFHLFESAAILKYLCETRYVADHWYPSDAQTRAKIDEYLAWHHTNLRMGAALSFRKTVLVPMFTGQPPDMEGAKKYFKIFDQSIKMFEKHFLADTKFISSNEISVADILAITEFSQMEMMGKNALPVTPKVTEWLTRCQKETEPHYSDVHAVMYKLKSKILASNL